MSTSAKIFRWARAGLPDSLPWGVSNSAKPRFPSQAIHRKGIILLKIAAAKGGFAESGGCGNGKKYVIYDGVCLYLLPRE